MGCKINYKIVKKKLPNGVVSTMDLIEHPGASLIIPFLSPRRMIFIRQYRAAINQYIIELPAGTRDKKEPYLKCAQRELIEETGYAAKKFKRLGKIYPVPGYSDEEIVIYRADDLYQSQALKDFDEIIETCVMSRREVNKMLKDGKIADAKTICALTMCGWC
ncbi:hypothetical protein MNBD_BACTEROID05-55 [hydrothermal vent metagenome]|uniref:Nudix hydrolase domain-containing protein n=1 Tax=hydrothermal vent metagenome TaxID=652676 RepID=A0A3B0TYL9_9ZZZZ